jgi:uncharacterized membrane protein YeaQ/YmgE (transglycosylase-associated protein family)
VGLFLLGMLLWGLAIGWVGQLLLGTGRRADERDWLQALVAGVAGSFVGGTVGSLLLGEGFQLRPGGVVASIAGAVVVLLAWNAIAGARGGAAKPQAH